MQKESFALNCMVLTILTAYGGAAAHRAYVFKDGNISIDL